MSRPAVAPAQRAARTLCLCADDFGLAPGISAGIARLARVHRLTAVSCITNSPHWHAAAPLLRDLPASVGVGLHINLTEGRPLSRRLAKKWPQLPALKTLMLRAHLGLLPRLELRTEIHAQLAAFRAATNAEPRYIDGHQHVHQLPGLRGIVLDLVENLHPSPAVRSTSPLPGPGSDFKRWLIRNSGGRALAQELSDRALAHNPALLGAYDFLDPDYRGLMKGWLAELPPQGAMIFCHPGQTRDGDPPDPIAPARMRELAYLESDLFARDLAAANVTLGAVWRDRQATLQSGP